jgi:4a-hydroxytetrahydrobiopterin dehydratase
MTLTQKKCIPCEAGTPPIGPLEARKMMAELDPSWHLVADHELRREFPFKDFSSALAFANKVGRLADEEGHHPNLTIQWGLLVVETWTHAIDGLSENDFILAAKIDELAKSG